MNAKGSGRSGGKPVVITRRFEEILKAVNFYRYMTALDVAHLLYSPSGIVRVRSRLNSLSGGDFMEGEYLYRLRLPDVPRGNPERIYALGIKGRDYLRNVLELPVDWYFRPERVKHMGFNVLMHDLMVTRVLVAAYHFARERPDLRVAQARICYELGAAPSSVEIETQGKMEKVSVVPDGWVMFETLREGRHEHWFPVLLEIDRSTMFRERVKRHIRSRVEFIASGEYERVFGTRAVIVAYATTSASGKLSDVRRKTLCAWAIEALRDMGREDWAPVFRFCSVSFGEIYMSRLFDDPLWYRPDRVDTPVRLFSV